MAEVVKREEQHPDDIVRIAEVVRRTTLSKTTIRRMIKRGEFPPGKVLSGPIRFWRRGDIDDWLEEREEVIF